MLYAGLTIFVLEENEYQEKDFHHGYLQHKIRRWRYKMHRDPDTHPLARLHIYQLGKSNAFCKVISIDGLDPRFIKEMELRLVYGPLESLREPTRII